MSPVGPQTSPRTVSGSVRAHIASATDIGHAYAVRRAAVEFALAGKNAVMPAIRRLANDPYRWEIVAALLAEIANREKLMPPDFITPDGFAITPAARRYLAPLIQGESHPPSKTASPTTRNCAMRPRRKSRLRGSPSEQIDMAWTFCASTAETGLGLRVRSVGPTDTAAG